MKLQDCDYHKGGGDAICNNCVEAFLQRSDCVSSAASSVKTRGHLGKILSLFLILHLVQQPVSSDGTAAVHKLELELTKRGSDSCLLAESQQLSSDSTIGTGRGGNSTKEEGKEKG